ncbi:hypothetical protein NESM_000459800 [Novymonas esmeraldas]|uniref:Uncharacterized protein n=1 Tax=Novymonas esmeraldas TaxID=1808958 RepID=A0AAW0ERA7_9TRYP
MLSETDGSDLGDSDRWMSTAVSVSHLTQQSVAATSDRYASAPLMPLSRFSRPVPHTELLIVDTPPSGGGGVGGVGAAHYRPPVLPQRLPLGRNGAPHDGARGEPLSTGVAAATHDHTPGRRPAAPQPTHSPVPRQTSLASAGCASDASTLTTNPTEQSLPYTWTDSYLDESPSTTKARWMQQHTFGPVLQSEGGGSSTVYSTPSAPCEAEAVWGGVLARNAAARECEAQQRQQDRGRTDAVPQRRFDLAAAETGGAGLGRDRYHDCDDVDFTGSECGTHAPTAVAKSLFLLNRAGASALTSNASTMIATVQQPRRAVHIAPVEKHLVVHASTTGTAVNGPQRGSEAPGVGKSDPTLSLTAAALTLDTCVSPATRDIVAASCAPSLPPTVNATNAAAARVSRPSSSNTSQCTSDRMMGESYGEVDQSCPYLRTSRCGPPRGRVLKPLYED